MKRKQSIGYFFTFFLIGGTIGWIVGLSQTAVINTILTSVLSIFTMIITVFSGFDKSDEKETNNFIDEFKKFNLKPFIGFLLGLSIIGTFGLWSKNNEKFIGININNTVNEWMKVLEYKNDYSLQYYEIGKFKQDSIGRKKIDSLKTLILLDSLKLKRFNNLMRFNIAKILFEQRYGVRIEIADKVSKELDTLTFKLPLIVTKETQKEQKVLTKGSIVFNSKEARSFACESCKEADLSIMRKNAENSGIKEIIKLTKQIKDNKELQNKLCELCEK